MSRTLQKIILVTGAVLLTLLVMEFGFRLYLTHFGAEHQRVSYLYSREEILNRELRFAPLPYLNYGLSPTHPDHNTLGYRGAEIAMPKPPGTFRIVALGGSTTYGTFIDHAEDAYPAQLERILRDDYGYTHVDVINAGVPGYKSWELFVNFAFRVLDLEPDMILIYAAVNDASARLVSPAYYDALNSGAGIWNFQNQPLPVSSIYRLLAVRLGWLPDPQSLTTQFHVPDDLNTCELVEQGGELYCANLEMTPETLLERNPPVYFERNLRNLIRLAQANDVQVMLSSWAYSDDVFDVPGGTFMTQPFRQQAVADNNRIIAQLAGEMDVPYYDFAAELTASHDWWVDGLHFNPQGAAEQASRYAAFIDAQELIR